MALKRFTVDGYGQLELNNVAFRRDGRVEAQCALSTTDFKDAPAENGMLLAVDNVTRTVKFATGTDLPVALNYTTEHMYDDRHNALKDFCVKLLMTLCRVLVILQLAISLLQIAFAIIRLKLVALKMMLLL